MAFSQSCAPLVVFGGATIAHVSDTFDGSDEAGATSYTLQYADDAGFSTNLVEITGITAGQKVVPALAEGTYYWRVKTVTGGVDSAFSDVDSFVIIPAINMGTGGSLLIHDGLGAIPASQSTTGEPNCKGLADC